MSKRRFYIICCLVCISILGSQPLASVQAAFMMNFPFIVATYGHDPGAAGATYPALAYNPQSQEYLAVWCHQLAGSVAIYARTISKTGVLGAPYPVSETATDEERCKPDVAYNTTDHNYLIVWEDKITGPQFSVHGRLFTPGGDMGPEITFNVSGSSNFVDPAVAYNSTKNEYLVVWAVQPFQSNYSILAQRLSNTGVKLGENYTVAQGKDLTNNYDPDVAFNPARNEYLVVWTCQSPDPVTHGLNRDIFGQILAYASVEPYNLIPLGGSFSVVFTSQEEYAPAVAAIQTPAPESGRYLVVWTRFWPDDGDHDIFGSIVKGDGTLIDIGAVAASSLDESAPAVTGNKQVNLFLVSWTSTVGPAFPLNTEARACTVSLQGNVFDKDWAGGIKAGMSAAASGSGGQFLVVFEDTTFFNNADLLGRFWGYRTFIPAIKK